MAAGPGGGAALTRRSAANLAACLLGVAACTALMAFDGQGWHDSTFDLNDGAGLFGAMILAGLALAHAGAIRRRFALRRRVRRRLGQALHERREARVDVNHAPAEVLAGLPGLDDVVAARMAELRPFSSVEDLGAALDLSADAVEELRPVTAFKA